MSLTTPTPGRKRRFLALPMACCLALLHACGGPLANNSSGDVTLRLADYLPQSDYHVTHGLQVFMEEAERLSDGSITFEHYPAEQLAAADDLLDSTAGGLADISLLGVPYHSDKLPLASVCALPGQFTTVETGTQACWQVTQGSHIQQEYLDNGVRPLYAHVNEPYGVQTVGTKVESLEDLEGLKLRSGGGEMSRWISAAGGTPVDMAGPETYEGVERGTLDGTLYPVLSLEPYDLGGPLDYGVDGVNVGSFIHTAVVNNDVWNTLTKDQQAALVEAGKKAMASYATWVDKNAANARKTLEADGQVDFYELDAAENKRWAAQGNAIAKQWATSLEADGLPASEVLRSWTDAMRESQP